MNNIENVVKKNLLAILHSSGSDIKNIHLNSSLKYDLDLSSIEAIALISSLEKVFNITINLSKAKQLNNVNDIVKFIRREKNEE